MSSEIDVKEAPFGTWQSPITSDMVATSSKSITELYTSGNNVFWGESRPEDGGKVCICTIDNTGNIIRLSPEGTDVGNRVHEYGGRSSMVADGFLFFTENSDQRIYSMHLETREITPITQQPFRYADMVYDKYKRAIVAVREDHTTTPPTNAIVAVDIASHQDFVLIEGNDFYSSPRISPRGDKLAYVTWNHPNMPWDSTQLWIFDRESGATTLVAGKSESIMEPVWSPDNILYFITDRRNGWWNIHRFKRDKIECVYEVDAEVGGPCWTFGHSSFVFVDENKLICDVTFKDKTVLTLFDIPRQIATAFKTRSTAHEFLCIIQPNGQPTLSGRSAHTTNYVYFKSSAHVRPKAVVQMVVDLNSATAADESGGAKQGKSYEISPELQIVVSTGGDKLQTIDKNYFSVPETVEFLASGRVFSYGYFYNPKNPRFNTPGNELPPVLVFVHGGPTASTSCDLDLKVQYWTTRGFAVFDVNYGGSTGYGKPYRERLYKQWGIVDVDDCCCGLQYLIDMGRVDPERTCISGGSAGGYTVLACLTFRDLFKTGASYYGVSDPSRLAQDTHKFEARYLDNLIGPYPGEKHLYEQRSPLYNVTKLNRPVIFFQGLEDKVVTPVQTELMYAAVKDKKLPASMILFENEYHGFHLPATVKQCLESEFYFYCKIFGIDVLEPSIPLIIENEDKIQ